MSVLTLKASINLVNRALAAGREICAALLTIAVLGAIEALGWVADAGGSA